MSITYALYENDAHGAGCESRDTFPLTMEYLSATLSAFVEAVQTNCDISDAQYASDYGLCIYLLKMRDYFRWEKQMELDAPISNPAVGEWIGTKEASWEELAERPLQSLPIGTAVYDPFDVRAINAVLAEHGMVYGGGIGRFAKPHFFAARLIEVEQLEGYSVWVAGEEYARELVAPPAMMQGDAIFVRKESLRRMLFEHLEEWRWSGGTHSLTRVFEHYDVDKDSMAGIDAMTNREMETLILHEIGELIAGEMIGTRWQDMMCSIIRTKAETFSRAVKDHLADCVCLLPALLDDNNAPSLHFYFANMGTLRRELFPALDGAYRGWVATGDARSLKFAVRAGKDHWLGVAEQILEVHSVYGNDSASRIEALVKHSSL